jgi:hypothetical protein
VLTVVKQISMSNIRNLNNSRPTVDTSERHRQIHFTNGNLAHSENRLRDCALCFKFIPRLALRKRNGLQKLTRSAISQVFRRFKLTSTILDLNMNDFQEICVDTVL